MIFTLTTDSAQRKDIPIRSGALDYFPAAIAGVAVHSVTGNKKHNPGEELHHARGKSMDHADCVERHLTDIGDIKAAIRRGEVQVDDVRAMLLAEANALSWRSLALSQEIHEEFGGAPLAPAARLPGKSVTFTDITETSQSELTHVGPPASRKPKCPICGFNEFAKLAPAYAYGTGSATATERWICEAGHHVYYFGDLL